jgi:hypothetical protein
MQLFEWGVTSNSTGADGRLRSVGITDDVRTAHIRVLEALASVSADHLARGWINALALGPDRLTYDRLDVVTQVTRNKEGQLRWEPGDIVPHCATLGHPTPR